MDIIKEGCSLISYNRQCLFCSEVFVPKFRGMKAKYCSNKHKYLHYYSINKDKINKRCQEYEAINKEAVKERKRTYTKKRRQVDLDFKLAFTLRCRLANVIKRNEKVGSFISDLGCSVVELKTYLESKFQSGMTWDNWSQNGWHIDHILPLSSFDLTNREEFLKACHYTNLQPLWAEDNRSKGGAK